MLLNNDRSGTSNISMSSGSHSLTMYWTDQVLAERTGGFQTKDLWLFVCSLGLVTLFDYLFYGKSVGVSIPIAVALFYCIFLWTMKGSENIRTNMAWLLLIPIGLLAMTYVIFSNPVFRVLNMMAIPCLIAVHTILLTRNHNNPWYHRHFVRDVIRQVLPRSLRNFPLPYRFFNTKLRTNATSARHKKVTKIVFGLVLSIPILVVVVSLLASADKVFDELISSIPNVLTGLDVGEVIFRVLLILFVGTYTFSYLWGLVHPQYKDDTLQVVGKEGVMRRRSFDTVVTLTVLVVINSVYLLFVLIQFSYLFGSGEGVLPDGTTYAEYARSGFGELVIVTLINFSLLLIVIHSQFKEASRNTDIIVKAMLTLLIGSTVVMLSSSFIRLVLYEQAYGYTVARILVHAFLIFLFVLLMLLLYRVWREHPFLLKQYLIVGMVAFITVNYMNIDHIIVNQNIARYEQTGQIDLYYLGTLSYDAVPELVKLSEQANKPEGLEDILHNLMQKLNQVESWSSYNVSKHRARLKLETLSHSPEDMVMDRKSVFTSQPNFSVHHNHE